MRRMSARMRWVRVRARRSGALDLDDCGAFDVLAMKGSALFLSVWLSALAELEWVLVGISGQRNTRKPALTVSAVKVRPYILL